MPDYKNPLAVPKKPRVPTYNMTASDLEVRHQKAVREGIASGIYVCNAMYSAAMLTVLRDTLGYGQKRLSRIFTRVQKLFGEVVERRVSYADLAQALMDECGVNLIIEKPDGVRQEVLDLFQTMERPAQVRMEVKQWR